MPDGHPSVLDATLETAPRARRPGRKARFGGLSALASLAIGATAVVTQASGIGLTNVSPVNPKSPGIAVPNGLSPEVAESSVAQGSSPLENPSGAIAFYGYLADGPMVPLPGTTTEASKTEPDKNTYLVLARQHGADPTYDYGREFLFQGHEAHAGYITRINLEADAAHRVTLLASTDVNGLALPNFDGSAWYPFSQRLLFTAELGASGGLWQATPDFPSRVMDLSGIFGRGGYEGVQADSAGNIVVVEDSGGKAGSGALSTAKQPNSFVFRLVPKNTRDLTAGGRLQVLQVRGLDGNPIVFGGTTQAQIDASITSTAERDLHTYGNWFHTTWVTIHDSAIDGTVPFDANALAKSKGGTPFKRPENGQFRPEAGFREFFFDETGDTNADSAANASFGGWGSIMRLKQHDPRSNSGILTPFFIGDATHSAFDNVSFLSRDEVVFVEDRGDLLHSQLNALDSAWVFDTRIRGPQTAIRLIAQGRDASATIDSGLGGAGVAGFQNDGDNEITGFHVSDGSPQVRGLIGTRSPEPFHDVHAGRDSWRVFYTQQHGDNVTYELSGRP